MSTSCSSNNDFSSYKKPNFTIEFSAKRLGLEIRVNDIPAFSSENTGFMTLEIPVNEYMINGKNSLSIITHPLFDDDDEQEEDYIPGSSVNVALYIREDDEPTDNRVLIDNVVITPGNAYLQTPNDPVALQEGQSNASQDSKFNIIKDAKVLDYPLYGNFIKQVITTWAIEDIKSNLPRWQWQDGATIPSSQATYKSLSTAYSKLHTAFMRKDLTSVKQLSEQRSKELAIAYHLKNTDAGFDYSALGKHIDHETIKIYEKVFLDHTKLEVFGHGKLARIMDGGKNHPVVFSDIKTEQLYQPQFMWYLNKNNEWVLIR